MDTDTPLSEKIREDFDQSFQTIKDGEEQVSFSIERILDDLVSSDISVLDALDIIYEARPHFFSGMSLMRITKVLNQTISAKGYPSSAQIRGSFNPLIIEYDQYEEILTFKQLKTMVSDELTGYNYSVSTFKAIVEELYRVLKSLRTSRFKQRQVTKIIPSVIRSILDIDLFDPHGMFNRYTKLTRLYADVDQQWPYIPDEERVELVISCFNQMATIFLLLHDHLPGINIQSTMSQLNVLTAELLDHNSSPLDSSDLVLLGMGGKSVADLKAGNTTLEETTINWHSKIHEFASIISTLVHRDVIKWIVITDQHDREVYSFFTDHNQYQSLIGMALSGIQGLIKEVTSDTVKTIEQDDGYIVIENRSDFRAVFFVKSQLSTYLKDHIIHFVNDVENQYNGEIKRFNGNVKRIKEGIDPLVDDHLGVMIA